MYLRRDMVFLLSELGFSYDVVGKTFGITKQAVSISNKKFYQSKTGTYKMYPNLDEVLKTTKLSKINLAQQSDLAYHTFIRNLKKGTLTNEDKLKVHSVLNTCDFDWLFEQNKEGDFL